MGGQKVDGLTIDAFNKKAPNVKIEYQEIPWQQYWEKINATLASGSGAPDVWNTAPTFYYEYVKRGQLADLQPFIMRGDINLDDFFQGFLDQWKAPSDYYGMPRDWVVSVLYYNKNMFDVAKVPYPDSSWDWTKLATVAKELTRTEGGRVSQWGLLFNNDRTAVDPLIYADGGRVLNADKTQCVVNQPEAVSTVSFLVDLVMKAKVSPPPGFFNGQPDPFLSGRVAMAITGSWSTGNYQKITHFAWDCTLFPKGKMKRVTYGGPDGLVISRQTKNLETAWQFLSFLVSKDCPLAWYTEGINAAPFNKTLAAEWAKQPPPPTWQNIIDSAQYAEADFNAGYNEWQTAKNNELAKAFLGQATPQQACDAAAKAVNDILKRNQ
jgi:multiple sugar transport system substrate-binding protein